jgi:hypothetical protein
MRVVASTATEAGWADLRAGRWPVPPTPAPATKR